MKVNGQLEVAQLENLTGDPAVAPRGRLFIERSTGKARLHNGSSFQNLAYESSTATTIYDNGASGQAQTITWTNGNIQKLRLTNNCLISFAGGVDGTEYTLILECATATTFGYTFGIGAQDALSNPIQPLFMNYGEVRVHKFVYRGTLPAAVTTTLASDVSVHTYINGVATGLCLDLFQPGTDEPLLCVGTSGAANQLNVYPFRRIYGKAEWHFSGSTTATGVANLAYRFSPSSAFIAIIMGTSPYLNVYRTTSLTGIPAAMPTIFANPATLPTGAGTSGDWHPSERSIAISHTTSPYISVYPWSAAGFGVKWTNPATLPAGNGLCCAFSPLGDYLAVTHTTTPFISIYAFDLVTGFGAKSADATPLPATQTVGSPRSVAWSPDGSWVVMGTGTTPFVWACPFNRLTATLGTPQTNPAVNIPAAEVRSVAFSKDGAFIFIGATGSAAIFPFSSSTGIDWANPLTTGFAALTYIDAVWSNFAAQVFTVVTATTGAPISHTLGYYPKNWVRTLDG